MDFIDFEAMEDGCNEDLIFSDDENKDSGKVDDTFIDDSKQKENEPDFYRSIDQKRDLNELSSYKKFVNQTRDPGEAIYDDKDDETFVDKRDLQPEPYANKSRESIIFDDFLGHRKFVQKFKKSLSSFEDSKTENSFFDAVIYGLLFKLSGGKSLTRYKVESVLGKEYYNDFCEIKDELKLDTSFYGYFNKSFKANALAAKKNIL